MVNFTTRKGFFLYSFDIDKEELVKLNNFLYLLDISGVTETIDKATKKLNYQGRYKTNPYNMLATVLYAFMVDNGHLREIERSCKVSLDYMYLMDNERVSYVTFSNFINEIIVPNIDEIFMKITKAIIKETGVDTSDIFIDGSKFEANANKYKFVWKPRKNLVNLEKNIVDLFFKYNIKISKVDNSSITESIFKLIIQAEKLGIDITKAERGRGKKLLEIQKDYFKSLEYLKRFLKYSEQIDICGPNRNSYFKTDHEATAMCLKEDYYSGLGSNMHAAYNVQFIVSRGFILGVYASQDRNDYITLIPCIELYKQFYGDYPINVCADSGYGSYANYRYIKSLGIGNYIKYPSWQQEMSGRYPILFHIENDEVLCLNNKIGKIVEIEKRHPKNPDAKFYRFTGCNKCNYKSVCKSRLKKKSENFRISEISINYLKFLDEVRDNLLSPKGIELRINRSIQVEGEFGNIKQNLSYTRFRRRGLDKIKTEITLMAMGINIRKYLRFKNTNILPNFWISPDNLQAEEQPKIKIPKVVKVKQKSVNQISKDNYRRASKKTVKS